MKAELKKYNVVFGMNKPMTEINFIYNDFRLSDFNYKLIEFKKQLYIAVLLFYFPFYFCFFEINTVNNILAVLIFLTLTLLVFKVFFKYLNDDKISNQAGGTFRDFLSAPTIIQRYYGSNYSNIFKSQEDEKAREKYFLNLVENNEILENVSVEMVNNIKMSAKEYIDTYGLKNYIIDLIRVFLRDNLRFMFKYILPKSLVCEIF